MRFRRKWKEKRKPVFDLKPRTVEEPTLRSLTIEMGSGTIARYIRYSTKSRNRMYVRTAWQVYHLGYRFASGWP